MDDLERRRLLYVAATRARDHLVVSLHRKPPGRGTPTNAQLLASAGATGAGASAVHRARGWCTRRRGREAAAGDRPAAVGFVARRGDGRPGGEPAARGAVTASGLEGTEPAWRPDVEDVNAPPGSPRAPGISSFPHGRRAATARMWGARSTASCSPSTSPTAPASMTRSSPSAWPRGCSRTPTWCADWCPPRSPPRWCAGPRPAAPGGSPGWQPSRTIRTRPDGGRVRPRMVRRRRPGRPPDGTVLEGIIDLMYREEDGSVVIVDYKTDAIPAAALQVRADFYGPQIRAYARAVRAATGARCRASCCSCIPDGRPSPSRSSLTPARLSPPDGRRRLLPIRRGGRDKARGPPALPAAG